MKERWITIDVSGNAPEIHPDTLPDRAPDPAVARAYAWTLAVVVGACVWLVLGRVIGCVPPAMARAGVDAIEAAEAERGAE